MDRIIRQHMSGAPCYLATTLFAWVSNVIPFHPDCKIVTFFFIFRFIFLFLRPMHDCYVKFTSCST